MRTLLVGLDNPHSGDPKHALSPLPAGATGGRIVEFIQENLTEYTVRDYLRDFDRVNLYPSKAAATGKGATKLDRLMAKWCLIYSVASGHQNIVLFGNRVRSAFSDIVELADEPVLNCQTIDADWLTKGHRITFYTMPHPSGRNRWYNDKRNQLLVADRLANLRERRHRERAT